jgi:hypothetical protein
MAGHDPPLTSWQQELAKFSILFAIVVIGNKKDY